MQANGTAGLSIVRSALERGNDNWDSLGELEPKIKAVAAVALVGM